MTLSYSQSSTHVRASGFTLTFWLKRMAVQKLAGLLAWQIRTYY